MHIFINFLEEEEKWTTERVGVVPTAGVDMKRRKFGPGKKVERTQQNCSPSGLLEGASASRRGVPPTWLTVRPERWGPPAQHGPVRLRRRRLPPMTRIYLHGTRGGRQALDGG